MIFNKFLVNLSENHRKYYKIQYDQRTNKYLASWGRNGSSGQSKTYESWEIEDVYTQKINKGYTESSEYLFMPVDQWRLKNATSREVFNSIVSAFGYNFILEELIETMYERAEHEHKLGAYKLEKLHLDKAKIIETGLNGLTNIDNG